MFLRERARKSEKDREGEGARREGGRERGRKGERERESGVGWGGEETQCICIEAASEKGCSVYARFGFGESYGTV